MRRLLLTTAMMVIPGLASAQSQCSVTKAAEPFLQLPPPVDVSGRPVTLHRRAAPMVQSTADGPRVAHHAGPSSAAPSVSQVTTLSGQLDDIPVLRHIGSAGASLTELGTAHGLRTVVAKHGGDFMVFQVASDGQVAVAGLMTDLTVDQLKTVAGSALTELDPQHGLRSFFLRNGARFQVFYATPDGERIIPGVMWNASGQDVTRKAIATIPGVTPTVTVGEAAQGARLTPANTKWSAGESAALTRTAYGTAGSASAPQLWIFIDPQCTFSMRAMQQLQPYVEAGRVQLHLIPLSILDNEDNGLSTIHALGLVSTRPDQMLTAWESGHYPDSNGSDARPKLAVNMAAAAASQVRGTPTFFWRKADGSQGRMDGIPTDMDALIMALGS